MAPARDGRNVRRSVGLAAVVVALLAIGAAGGVWWTGRRVDTVAARTGASAGSPVTALATASEEPVEITLTEEAVTRAGIKSVVVEAVAGVGGVTVPGTVASNAYRDTKVNALVGGVTRAVSAELGAAVRRGDVLAVIFSAELAEAQMKYLSMRATFEADHLKMERTKSLLQVGAVSRQEMEEVTAFHDAHDTELAAARQRLLVLGLSSDQVEWLRDATQVVSDISVRAPAEGTVIARSVNPGQVVMPGQELFTVTDLRTVWVIGDLYEKDFGRVRVGAPATITVPADAGAARQGRVAYIDPRVDSATRTAKVRVEAPNPNAILRLGMFVTVTLAGETGALVAVVPKDAVQSVAGRTVVYVVADGEPRFTERVVKLGASVGDRVQVLDGVKAGERVVTEGSFMLRAEASRTRSGS
ncbi:MAG: efflux RND transporter periplasmic adaptor subunit [Candidatus Rokubacteria bacterium]|nr:efflux RND transporter periplasmic adaptor subunit [Candidatus Rokubacteria bacterium]